MDRYDIQKLRSLPIESVAERLGLRVSHHKALCPFHEDRHPSLSFSVGRNAFKCFVCDAHGGTIDLAMKVLGKNFVEACQWLANENNVILSSVQSAQSVFEKKKEFVFDAQRYSRHFERPWLSDAARSFLYDERHLDPRVIRWCRLTSWRDKQGTDWLQIPYFDMNGTLIGIQNRNLNYGKTQKNDSDRDSVFVSEAPRFRFPKGSVCKIYNLPVLKMLKPDEPLFITEGCSDCWAMLSSGHKAVAIPSATLLKTPDLQPLKGRICHIYPDQDTAGNQLYERLLEASVRIGFCLVRHDLPSGCKDYSDYYLQKKMLTVNA